MIVHSVDVLFPDDRYSLPSIIDPAWLRPAVIGLIDWFGRPGTATINPARCTPSELESLYRTGHGITGHGIVVLIGVTPDPEVG